MREHKHRHATHFDESEFILALAYLADIFGALNHLNCQMQGGGVNIIEAEEKLCAFRRKLPLWRRRTENNNFANFSLLDECVSGIEDENEVGGTGVPEELKQGIATHLEELGKSFDGYFPDKDIHQYPTWVRQPFTFDVATADMNDPYLDDLIELQQSQTQQQLFGTTTLSTFWCRQMEGYPRIAKATLEILTPFVTSYLCEQGFSKLVEIKTKKRSRLDCENDMRVALAKTKPRISQIATRQQEQKTH